MAEQQCVLYASQFGYPPSKPSHLIQFAKKNGVKVTWTQAKKVINGYKMTNKTESNSLGVNRQSQRASKRKSALTLKPDQKMDAAKRYSRPPLFELKHVLSPTKEKEQIFSPPPNEKNGDMSNPMQQEQTQLTHKPNTSELEIQMYRFPTAALLNESPVPDEDEDNASHGHQRIQSKYISNILGKNRSPKVEVSAPVSQKPKQQTEEKTVDDDQKEKAQKDLKEYVEQQPNEKKMPIIKVENEQPKNQFHPNAEANDRSFEVLLSGHGSIKHRIQAMGQLKANLELLDIEADNGRVLIHAFAVQILHIDYIHHKNEVRNAAIDYIADVFIACLDALSRNKINELVQDSLPEIFDNLYKILDDESNKDMHEDIQQVIIQIIKAIDAKRNKSAIIHVCELLVEKANISNVALATARFFAAKQLFKRIIFRNRSKQISEWFDIDLRKEDNYKTMKKHKNGQGIDKNDLPNNRDWFDIMIAEDCDNDKDEAFKDLLIECLSVMILDENNDIAVTASNMIVFINEFNDGYNQCLEPQAMHRFINYLCSN